VYYTGDTEGEGTYSSRVNDKGFMTSLNAEIYHYLEAPSKVSDCCGSRIFMGGFCSDCKDHCGEVPEVPEETEPTLDLTDDVKTNWPMDLDMQEVTEIADLSKVGAIVKALLTELDSTLAFLVITQHDAAADGDHAELQSLVDKCDGLRIARSLIVQKFNVIE